MNKQEEILTILQEECAEVIQAISKMRRFGMENNREQFEQEVADCLCMINLCYEHGILEKSMESVKARIKIKEDRLKQYSNIYSK
jgi:NTP pyrophosphatase (non-canonical NTP hydrolase)